MKREFQPVAQRIFDLLPDTESDAQSLVQTLMVNSGYCPPECEGATLWMPLDALVKRIIGPDWTPQDPCDLWKLDIVSELAGRDVRNDPPQPVREETSPPTIYDWSAYVVFSKTFGCDTVHVRGREYHGGAITTSPVLTLDRDTNTVETVSGSLYKLDGEVLASRLPLPNEETVARLKIIKATPRHLRAEKVAELDGEMNQYRKLMESSREPF